MDSTSYFSNLLELCKQLTGAKKVTIENSLSLSYISIPLKLKEDAYQFGYLCLEGVTELTSEIKIQLQLIVHQIEITATLAKFEKDKAVFETLTKMAPIGIWVTDKIGTPLFVNQRWEEMFGMNLEELKAGKGHSVYPENEKEEISRRWRKTLSDQIDFDHEMNIINIRTNKKTPVHALGRPLYQNSGELAGFVGINYDLTERKRIKDQLILTIQRFEKFIEFLPATVCILDKNMCYLAVSQKWIADYHLDQKGYTVASLKGKSHYDIFPNLKAEWKVFHQQALQGKTISRTDDSFYNLVSGETEWLNWEISPWFDVNGEIGGILMQTVVTTALKKHETALINAKKTADEASKAKSLFLANISHEIRTPLNSIIGYSGLLSEHTLEPELMAYVRAINTSAEILHTLINDVLDISKIEASEMTLEKIAFDLGSILENINLVFSIKCLSKNVKLKIDCNIPRGTQLKGDPTRLTQVLLNLIGNAVKFTDFGEVNAQVNHDNGMLSVKVQDTGIGIPEDKLPLIFENFSQGDGFINRKYGGTGLGLSISQKLIQLMGGEIKAESTIGLGSSFSFSIPIEICRQLSVVTTTSYDAIDSKLKILVVDDSDDNQKLMKVYLKSFPEIKFCNNGQEALELMKEERFDTVFMDMQMPVMDGREATRLYRDWEKANRKYRTTIIALSACSLTEEVEGFYADGCDLYLTKPVKKSKVFETLSALGRRN